MGEAIDLVAVQKWNKIPKDVQRKLLDNVWCGGCSESCTIVDYTMINEDFGLVLRGSCKKCGGKVARVLEDE